MPHAWPRLITVYLYLNENTPRRESYYYAPGRFYLRDAFVEMREDEVCNGARFKIVSGGSPTPYRIVACDENTALAVRE